MSDHEHRPAPKEQAVDHDQAAPGSEAAMRLKPDSDLSTYRAAGKMIGKVAIVTGGDSGIGRAVALAYAMEGAMVAVVYDQSDDDAAEAVRLIERAGARGLAVKADVSDPAACARAVGETLAAFGRLDVLVNNAAVFEGAPLAAITPMMLERIFRVNVFGYVYMAQAALAQLETNGGCVINTSSSTSILGKTGAIPYSSTKGAINVLTKSMALELAPKGVRVNAVLPGPFWTPAIATGPAETTQRFGSFTMLKRAGQPEEIAPLYVHLAAEAPFTTGALYEVTGGFRAVD